MSSTPRWGRILRLHLGLFAALAICASGFVIEVLRATGGNELSWAYVFEWPFLFAYAIYMWRRLLDDERRRASGRPDVVRPPRQRRTARARARAARRELDEASALDAWNAYLRDVNPTETRSEGP